MQLPQAIPTSGFTLETSDRKPRRIGLGILAIVFGGFGLWAMLAPMDSAALAPGVVTVKNYRKTVQHLEGGIVSEILVSDGQVVAAGQTLLALDSTQAQAELDILKGQYFTTRAMDNRLTAERDALDIVVFADDLDAEDLRALEAIKNEEQIFTARRNERLGEIEVLEQRIIQHKSQIDGLRALIASKQEIIKSYSEEVKDLSALLVDGFVDKQRLREVERNRSSLMGEVADKRATIAQTEVAIGETRLQILQLNKQFTMEVADQLAKTQGAVYDLREKISAIEDTVRRTRLIAPVSGIVIGMNTHTVGGVIRSGEPILDIVPEREELVIEARVSPHDIDRVAVGTDATVRFSAFSSATTPKILAVVTNISADRLIDEKTGAPYYLAQVEVSEEGTKMLGSLTLIAGMPAEVLIKTGQRTLFQYLVQPASNILARSLIEE